MRQTLTTIFLLALAPWASAQDSGLLFNAPASGRGGLTLETASFLHQPLAPEAAMGQLKVQDVITVLVDYRSTMLSESEAQSRKTASINGVLSNWIGFDGKSIFAAEQSGGDPRIAGSLNSQYRAQGDLELRDELTFRIAATVVDIRPNGTLVIEAHRTININDETWQQSLTGVVPRTAIGPDRTVRSDSIADLKIHKRELGQVRNAYAPGWLGWWWSNTHPF